MRVLKALILILVLLVGVSCSFAYDYREVRAEHILVKTKSQADELRVQIDEGKSFEELANNYSMCPSGRSGGDLGYFTRGQMVPEFEEPAFNMAIGEISAPIHTQFGWHIIKVLDKR